MIMAFDWIKRNAPKRETILGYRFIKPFAPYLSHGSLWHFNRRSVTRGIGLGLFFAFVAPVAQIIVATIIAVPLRANLAVTALMTTVTNPLTVGLMAPIAHKIGKIILNENTPLHMPGRPQGMSWWDWVLDAKQWEAFGNMLAGPWAVGMAVMGVVAGLGGYIISNLLYAGYLRTKRKRES
jgi:uncharacterized protein